MQNNLVHLDVEFDKKLLLEQANEKEGWKNWQDPKTGRVFNDWYVKHVDSGYAMAIAEYFKKEFGIKDCRPRFFWTKAGFNLPFHKDRGTLCAVSFMLYEEKDPISFEDSEVEYTYALLNVSKDHAVFNSEHDRLQFKLSIFDKSFEELRDVLPSKIQIG